MPFHFAALDTDIFFKLATGHVEGVTHRDIHVFVRLPVMMLAADDDVLAGNGKVDADMEEVALVLVLMVKFDCDFATDDVVAELLQFRRFFADSRLYGVGVWKAAKRDL
jgi:hypothetical protein